MLNRRATVFLAILLFAGIAVRLIDLTDEPLDFHPTRQLRSAIIARGMYYQMLPAPDPLLKSRAIALWQNLEVYEPEIFERLAAVTYLATGVHPWVARIYDALFWAVGGLALWGLCRRIGLGDSAFIALGFYLFLPWGVIASRSFQPDPLMTVWILIAAYAIIRWSENHSLKWSIISGASSGIAVIIKTVAVFPLGVLFVVMVIPSLGWKSFWKQRPFWAAFGLFVLLPASYYLLMIGNLAGSFFAFWSLSFIHMLVTPGFYSQWLYLLRQILGLTPILLGLVGFLILPSKGKMVAIGLWSGYLVYGLTLPYQISSHTYYSLMTVPFLAILIASFSDPIINKLTQQRQALQVMFLGVALASVLYCVREVRTMLYADDFRQEALAWQRIGQALPKDGKIIAVTHDYGNRLIYYGWTQVYVWPSVADSNMASLRGGNQEADYDAYFSGMVQGFRYFLIDNFIELDAQPMLKSKLEDHFTIAQKTNDYILYDLSKPIR